jgi:hypothetical protein
MDLGLCWCLILRLLIDFWKLCGLLVYKIFCIYEMTAYKLSPVRSHVAIVYQLYSSDVINFAPRFKEIAWLLKISQKYTYICTILQYIYF